MKRLFTRPSCCCSYVWPLYLYKAADTGIRIGLAGTALGFCRAQSEDVRKGRVTPEFLKFISGPPMLAAPQGENIDVAFMTVAPAIFALSQAQTSGLFTNRFRLHQALISTKEAARRRWRIKRARRSPLPSERPRTMDC
jgi:hypothetical protein